MTEEERDAHLVLIKMTQPHFDYTWVGGGRYENDDYCLSCDHSGRWILATRQGDIILEAVDHWYDLALKCGFTIWEHKDMDSIRAVAHRLGRDK